MLVVTVEVWPGGNPEYKRTMGVAHIVNTGEGNLAVGTYDVRLLKWTKGGGIWRRGRVVEFPRKVGGPWDLLYLALKDALAGRAERIMKGERG